MQLIEIRSRIINPRSQNNIENIYKINNEWKN